MKSKSFKLLILAIILVGGGFYFSSNDLAYAVSCSSNSTGGEYLRSGTYRVYAYGVSSDTNGGVYFPNWSPPNQTDMIWGEGTNAGNGTWYYDIDIDRFSNTTSDYSPIYFAIYMYDNTWTPPYSCGGDTYTIYKYPPYPSTPTGLSVAPNSCGTTSLNVSWNAAAYAQQYTVYRTSSPGVNTLPYMDGSGTSFTDTGLTAGGTYTYRVLSSNACDFYTGCGGSSSYSSGVSGTVASDCPVDCVGNWGLCSDGSQTYTITTNAANGGASCPYADGATWSCGTPGACAATHYDCAVGTPFGNTENSTYWSWGCNGLNGGTNTSPTACTESIPSPTNLTSSCSASGATANLSWTLPSGYNLSYFRLSNLTTNTYPASWIPENVADTGPSTSVATTPGHSYSSWVHTRLPSGSYSSEIYSSFACPCAPPLTQTQTQGCATGYTGLITQSQTKAAAPSCAWGAWTTTSNTCTINTYTLTVSKAGNGTGIVTSSPAGINCGATCSASYNYNTTVTLTASASAGSTFAGWSGDCSTGGAVTMTAARSCTATFTNNPATIGNVTISSTTVYPNNSTPYTITVSGSDGGGAGQILSLLGLINYQGENGDTSTTKARGYLMWNTGSTSYWAGSAKAGSTKSCSGSAAPSTAIIYGDYGPQYLNLSSCSVSDSGNTRTVSFVVTFDPVFTNPVTDNDISGYVYDNLWQGPAAWTNFQTNFNLNANPTMSSVTINPTPINPDNVTQYNIVATTSSPLGAAYVSNNYALINYQGGAPNEGSYRGYVTWYWADAWPGYQDHKACTLNGVVSAGGGFAVVQPGYGNQYIHLDSCAVTDSGTSRTTTFKVRFDPQFTTPTTNNDISGLGCSIVNGIQTCDGWTNFQTNFGLSSFALTVNTAGAGSGTAGTSGAYSVGTVVTLTKSASTGSTFSGWSGDADCTDGSVTMNANKTCTATFTLNTYSLSINKTGTGTGTVTGAGTYNYGQTVTATATPNGGSTFNGWTGDCNSSGQVTMTIARSCTATFTLTPINGGWTNPWSACTVTACGCTGTQSRTCTNPAPANGGLLCTNPLNPNYDGGNDTQPCSTSACPVGTLSVTSSCTIKAGASICSPLGPPPPATVTWDTTNLGAGSVAVTRNNPGTTISTAASGTNVPDSSVNYGASTYYLYFNGNILATANINASCASGSKWNGSICQATLSMSGTLTPASASCDITADNSSCPIPVNISWSVKNYLSTTSAITAIGMTDKIYSNIYSGTDSFTVPYPGRTFYLYNNATELAKSTVTAKCATTPAPGTTWNGTKCVAVNACIGVNTCQDSAATNAGGPLPCTYPVGSGANINASPSTIVSGKSSTLIWSGSGTCTGTNFSTGGISSGSLSVSPNKTTTYTLTCGTSMDQATVIVNKKPVFIEN